MSLSQQVSKLSSTANQIFSIIKYTEISGIYRDKTLADKLVNILNDNTQNYPFCRSQLICEKFGTNQ